MIKTNHKLKKAFYAVDLSLSPLKAGRAFFELAERGIFNKNIVYENRCLDYARH